MEEKTTDFLGPLRTEIDTVKTENQLLRTKVNLLHSLMQTRLETMEQRLKVAELEKKLTGQEIHNLVAAKVREANGQLAVKLDKAEKRIDQLELMLTNKMEEGKVEMQNRDKKMEAELGKMANQLDQGMTVLRAKMNVLKSQTVIDQKKWEQTRDEVEGLYKHLSKTVWNNNQWDTAGQKHVQQADADGVNITVTATIEKAAVRAKQPISSTMLAYFSSELPLVYFEVQVKRACIPWLGWVIPDVPLNSRECRFGQYSGSYALNCYGGYWESGHKVADYNDSRFKSGDVLGSGLSLTRDGRLNIFFTLNGRLNGKPMKLPANTRQNLLYPAVGFFSKNTTLEANFGADTEKCPFRFDIDAHKTKLFG